jgi:hypothetical protein
VSHTHTLRPVDLFLARLPLLRPFTTSSHTTDHLERIQACSVRELWLTQERIWVPVAAK